MSDVHIAEKAVRAYLHDSEDPFKYLRDLQKAIDIVTKEEVQRARNLGAPWTIIAERLDITRQTAVTRYRDTAG